MEAAMGAHDGKGHFLTSHPRSRRFPARGNVADRAKSGLAGGARDLLALYHRVSMWGWQGNCVRGADNT